MSSLPRLKTRTKTKTPRNLERVRQNQQRSRQRKREYVLELEAQVARLSAQLAQTGRRPISPPGESGTDQKLQALARLKRENKSRHDLLLALGVATSAQDMFVRASLAMRTATPQYVANHVDSPPPPAPDSPIGQGGPAIYSPSTAAGRPFDSHPGDMGMFPLPPAATESADFPLTDQPDAARAFLNAPDDALASMEAFPSTLEAPSNCDSSVTMHEQHLSAPPYPLDASDASEPPQGPTLSLESFELPGSGVPDSWTQREGFCTTSAAWSAALQANDASHAGTTACSIAFSMILKHNVRSLPLAQLESRLRVGYRGGQTVHGDCRILNGVLFSVLSEIS